MPAGWQTIPYTDVNCLATSVGQDTPDLTNLTGPAAANGVMGNAYSGSTFMSGLMGGPAPSSFYHEGFMQEISGFIVGGCYSVNFHQTVVKQMLADFLDTTGSWIIYLDDVQIGISAPTTSHELGISTNLPWEFRSLGFMATSSTHTFKFLPWDDDPDQSTNNPYGGLRMGIDSIYLINTNQQLSVELGNDTTLCFGETLAFDVNNTSATSYLWQDNSANPSFTVSQEGTYWVSVTSSCGSIADTVNVYYDAPVVVNLGNDTILCPNENLFLDASSTAPSYVWQDGSSSSTFTVVEDGIYWVTVTSLCASVTDSIMVAFAPLPAIDLGENTSLCQEETLTLDVAMPNATYLWNAGATTASIQATPNGTYSVKVTAGCGSATDSIFIGLLPSPLVDLGEDGFICLGTALTLDAAVLDAIYLWQNNASNQTLTVTEPGLYWVEVTTTCTSRDFISIALAECPVLLEIPNVFSPNGDGFNDLFTPAIIESIATMQTTIYNRWGRKIYETDDVLINWDGNHASDGVYFWIIRYIDIRGIENNRNGYLQIIR